MESQFDIPVLYQGQELSFPACVQKRGYQYQFQVEVGGVAVVFESDEEGEFRALMDSSLLESRTSVDAKLLQAIAQVLTAVTQA